AYRALVRGETVSLPELPVQYADFAAWQRRHLRGERLERELVYWRRQLEGFAGLELPTDRPRPPVQRFRGAFHPVHVPADLGSRVKALAESEGTTLFVVLLAAFDVLLARSSGQQDVAVGSPYANRNREETEKLIGFLVNTLVLRTDLSGDPTFRELIARVRGVTTDAYSHQDLPFARLVAELQPERSLSHNPLFQVLFALQTAPMPAMEFGGLTLSFVPFDVKTSMFDLSVSLWEADGVISGHVQYDVDLFDRATVERMVARYARILERMVSAPEDRVWRLPFLGRAERQAVVHEWVETRAGSGDARPVHRLVERWAARSPESVAVVHGDRTLTYGELDRRAGRLARRLRGAGAGVDVPVAVCLDRSPEMAVAVLAILKVGGPYVPIDPELPGERIRSILFDVEAPIVLTSRSRTALVGAASARPLLVDDDRAGAGREEAAPPVEPPPEARAYVLYTSGSTGRPKGVAMPHRALVNLLEWQAEVSPSGPGTRTLQFASLGFDVSFQETFATWSTGGTLELVDEDLRRDAARLLSYLTDRRIERLFVPFVALEQLAEAAGGRRSELPPLREVITAGEQLRSTPRVVELFDRLGGCRLHNHYGPTEAHVVTAHALPERTGSWSPLPPIGRPIDGARILLAGDRLQPVPIGVPGELLIGGVCVARGYEGRPALTAERFVPDPFSRRPGARLYRTGDLARHAAEGTIEYLGRNDAQVKVRGYRVEPGEVETVLAGHPDLQDAVVVGRRDPAGTLRLVAYALPADGPLAGFDPLREHLARQLPDYMVPSTFVEVDELPLTPSGKVDRNRLPEPEWGAGAVGSAPPQTPTEELLASIWAGVLGLAGVGRHDDFFELGGHSLLATQVVSRIREAFGIDVELRSLFEAPTVAAFARAVERERSGGRMPPIRRASRDGGVPLAFAQQRLWFLDQLAPGHPFYNIPTAFRLRGSLDPDALYRAVNAVIDRHESLRARFVATDADPVQVIEPELTLPLPTVDLSGLEAEVREREQRRLGAAESGFAFDLARGPVVHMLLARLAEDDHLFYLTLHHIVADGWSIGVLYRELGHCYAALAGGGVPDLPALPIQYPDFAIWQRTWLQETLLDEQLEYWSAQLAETPPLELPTDRPRPARESFRGALTSRAFPERVAEGVRALSREHGATQYMVLLAGLASLLHRSSGQSDFALGTTIANRHRMELEGLIGFFANTLVLRTDLSGDPAFARLLERVRGLSLEAYAHQDMPFEALVTELDPERNLSRNPLFQVMLTFLNVPLESLELAELEIEPAPVHGGVSKFDLLCVMEERGGALGARVEYNTDLFEAETVDRLLRQLEILLEGAIDDPDTRLSDLPLLSSWEREQVVHGWNATAEEFSGASASLDVLLTRQAELSPEAPALRFEGETLSYRELAQRSNRLARALRRLGVGPEVPVGVALERSFELVVSLVAVLKAGGAYVPIDPDYPRDRVELMVEDSGARVLLTQSHLEDSLPATEARVVCVDRSSAVSEESGAPLESVVGPESLSYVIYTSGSTGRPKGAMNRHGAVVNRLLWMQSAYGLSGADRVLQKTPASFDVSVWEFFWPLITGACLVVARPEGHKDSGYLARLIREDEVTVLHFVPSMLQLFLEEPEVGSCRSVRQVIASGEALSVELRDRLFERLGGARLDNLYGPTEAAIDVTRWRCEPGVGRASVPIGRPISNLQIHLVDRRMRPVPVGVAGELMIGGAGLGRGYWRRPGRTAESFVPDPFAAEPGGRLYRTGDLARRRPDGVIDFLGRIDHQVKVRGFRIELGEVEAALLRHSAVRDAVV
ncbi:MAG: amino acid adenylation domain-containing protein, partial [Acidobacteriota bacterium]